MIHASPRFARLLGVIALCVAVCGPLLTAGSAHARVYVGVGIPLPFYGPPAYYPPPVYYPPPYYVAPPPPVVYTPPPAPRPGYGQSCNAGSYVCPMERPVPTGSPCYCAGNQGQRVRGNAD